MTPIDGAIIMSPQGVVHAIGTILDGIATNLGDPVRGARYNSALRYVATKSKEGPCFAAIVSEDGGIEFLPKLRPAIHRSGIENAIKQILVQAGSSEIEELSFRKARNFLDKNKFYLLPEDCDCLNRTLAEVEERLRIQEGSSFSVIINRFAPDPEFSADLYYLEDTI